MDKSVPCGGAVIGPDVRPVESSIRDVEERKDAVARAGCQRESRAGMHVLERKCVVVRGLGAGCYKLSNGVEMHQKLESLSNCCIWSCKIISQELLDFAERFAQSRKRHD